jgi:zinc/manganese transport system permease protein
LAIGLLHWLWRGRLTGAGSLAWDFMFYATFGVVVTSSVAIAGVLLVFSFLIIPAAIGVMFADALGKQLAIGWIAGILTSAAALAASFAFDLPTAPPWSARSAYRSRLPGCSIRFCAAIAQGPARRARKHARARCRGSRRLRDPARRRPARGPAADRSRRIRAAVLRIALLHQANRRLRGRRRLCERYRREAEQLNERKSATARRRGARRVQRGADFLVPEILRRNAQGRTIRHGAKVRARARERARWGMSLGLLALALLVAPLPWPLLWRRLRTRSSR